MDINHLLFTGLAYLVMKVRLLIGFLRGHRNSGLIAHGAGILALGGKISGKRARKHVF